jgi:hypothetical protein
LVQFLHHDGDLLEKPMPALGSFMGSPLGTVHNSVPADKLCGFYGWTQNYRRPGELYRLSIRLFSCAVLIEVFLLQSDWILLVHVEFRYAIFILFSNNTNDIYGFIFLQGYRSEATVRLGLIKTDPAEQRKLKPSLALA